MNYRTHNVETRQGYGICAIALLTSACFIGLPESRAMAQTSSQAKAAAEAQFDEGITLMKSGDFPEACQRLESSQRVEPAVGTLLYLAECYARLRRIASAWATFREAASLAFASGQSERGNLAKERANALENQLPYLNLTASPELLKIRDLSVLRNGEAMDLTLLGTHIPVDPGAVRIEVRAPGYVAFAASVEVTVAARATFALPDLRQVPKAKTEESTEPLVTQRESVSRSHQGPASSDWVDGGKPESSKYSPLEISGLVVGGIGIVGLGIGTYFGLSAVSKNSDAEAGYCTSDICQRVEDLEKVNAARSNARISNLAFAAGGTALATGLLIYWLAPASRKTGWNVVPAMADNGVHLALSGRL